MRIKEKINQYRRDFTAIYECQFCGYEEKDEGYDDSYFHQEVVPKKECKKCGKSTISEGQITEIVKTKYPEGFQV